MSSFFTNCLILTKLSKVVQIVNNFSIPTSFDLLIILSKSDLNFSILIPLINKTISKLQEDTPKKIQTGPAKRNDIKIIKSHIKEIDDHDIELIYQNISNNIIKENG